MVLLILCIDIFCSANIFNKQDNFGKHMGGLKRGFLSLVKLIYFMGRVLITDLDYLKVYCCTSSHFMHMGITAAYISTYLCCMFCMLLTTAVYTFLVLQHISSIRKKMRAGGRKSSATINS